jgi:hypothetical protein
MRFCFVLYTTRCSAKRGRHDDMRTFQQRLSMYGGGIRKNAVEIQRLFPLARVLVFVPDFELLVPQMHTRNGAKAGRASRVNMLQTYLHDLCSVHSNVSVVPFSLLSLLPLKRSGRRMTNMTMGQILRCARYLPLCSSYDRVDKSPVVVRDADSIVSDLDAAIIKSWLAGPQMWLVFQELHMSSGLPMGGGVALKTPLTASVFGRACEGLRAKHTDEHLLGRLMPPSFRSHSFANPLLAPSKLVVDLGHSVLTTVSVHANRSVLCVGARLTEQGVWYTWPDARVLWNYFSSYGERVIPQNARTIWVR